MIMNGNLSINILAVLKASRMDGHTMA